MNTETRFWKLVDHKLTSCPNINKIVFVTNLSLCLIIRRCFIAAVVVAAAVVVILRRRILSK